MAQRNNPGLGDEGGINVYAEQYPLEQGIGGRLSGGKQVKHLASARLVKPWQNAKVQFMDERNGYLVVYWIDRSMT